MCAKRSLIRTPEEYINSLDGLARDWVSEFLHYLDTKYPALSKGMFRQRPMYMAGENMIYITAATSHFAIHTMDYDAVASLRKMLPKAGFGKDFVKVRFTDYDAKRYLYTMLDEIVKRNQKQPKRLPKYASVDGFILSSPEDYRQPLYQLRGLILGSAPDIEEMIRYNTPFYYLNGLPLVHFSVNKTNLVLTIGSDYVEAFKDQLDNVRHSKGVLQFSFEKGLPFPFIQEIITFKADDLIEGSTALSV